MSWRYQHKRKEKLRQQEELRRQRVLKQGEEKEADASWKERLLSSSSSSSPNNKSTTESTTIKNDFKQRADQEEEKESSGTPKSNNHLKHKTSNHESPLAALRREKKERASKKVLFGSPTNAATSGSLIDTKWLDAPPTDKTDQRVVWTDTKQPAADSSSKTKRALAKPQPPPVPSGNSSSEEEEDLLASFRKVKKQQQQQQQRGGEGSQQGKEESQSTASLKSIPTVDEQDDNGNEHEHTPSSPPRHKARKNSLNDNLEEFSPTPPPEHDEIQEFSDDDHRRGSTTNATTTTTITTKNIASTARPQTQVRLLDKSLMDDSSSDEQDSKPSSSLRPKRPQHHQVPHNPIALMNQQKQQQQQQTKNRPAIQGSPVQQQGNNASASLWSDSENDEEPESLPKQSKRKRKRATTAGANNKLDRSSTLRKKENSLMEDTTDDTSDMWQGDDRLLLLEDENDKVALRQSLHPIMEDPKFGPYELEPLVLANDNDDDDDGGDGGGDGDQRKRRHEVPAALSRYLATFQKEGVEFLYNCLSNRKTGAILGDDMGVGKTVQVIALLCALFGKTGTGLDLLEMKRRQTIVREALLKQRQAKEEALLQGQMLVEDHQNTKKWMDQLNLPDWYPVLIVVPPTVVENWKLEFAKFSHFSVSFYAGTKDQREQALQRLRHGQAEVMVASKSLFAIEAHFEKMNKVAWKLVVVDEFHHYKNKDGTLSQHLRKLKKEHRCLALGMTGTLMQNDHKELWNLIDLIEADYVGSWEDFKTQVALPIKIARTKTAKPEAIERAQEKTRVLNENLRKIFIERKKEDVLRDMLPEKSEKLVLCELSPLQKRVYEHILTLPDFELIQKAASPCTCGVNSTFFQKMQRLPTAAKRLAYCRKHKNEIVERKECCFRVPVNPRHEEADQPYIDPDAVIWRTLDAHDSDEGCKYCPTCCAFPGLNKLYKLSDHLALMQAKQTPGSNDEGSPEYISYVKQLEFAKVALPPDVVEQLPGGFIRRDGIMNDHFSLSGKIKVLHRLLLKYAKEGARILLFSYSTQSLDLIQNFMRSSGYNILRMDGTTATSKRQDLADKFNSDPSIFVFLLSTKAMGVGLNLTSANKVIIFDVEWNPSHDSQAQDRAYRIGQKQDVQVVRLVSRGTIDELKYLRQLYKLQLKQETLESSASAAPKAARLFRGIQGDKDRKGELFGHENLFRFKDGCFLDDIWKQTGAQRQRKSAYVDIREAASISSKLLGMEDDDREEALNGPSNELDDIIELAGGYKNKAGEWISKNGDDIQPEPMDDAAETGGQNSNELHIEEQAWNHQDLFRSDRGRAAIEEGEEGFDEEMGGGTQNLVDIYEGGVQMDEENPQDGSVEADSLSVPSAGEGGRDQPPQVADPQVDVFPGAGRVLGQMPPSRPREPVRSGYAQRSGQVPSNRRDRSVGRGSTQHRMAPENVPGGLPARINIPVEAVASRLRIHSNDRSNQESRITSIDDVMLNGQKEDIVASVVSSVREVASSRSTAVEAGGDTNNNVEEKDRLDVSNIPAPPAHRIRNIQLVGITSNQMLQNPIKTTFSAADLALPSYGMKKKKRKKKGKK